MKPRFFLTLVLIAAAAALGWHFGQRAHSHTGGQANGKKVAFYQSPMHPWIKSDKPGNCTICGMKLTPVYEGEKGFDIEGNVIALSSNAINVVNVQTEPAELHRLERTLHVAGRIEAQETRYKVISAYVDGRIDKLFVNYSGAEVQQGEPLAILYSPSLLTAEREFLAALSQTNLTSSPELAPEHKRLIEGARMRLKRLGFTDVQITELPNKGATNLNTQVVAPIGGTVVARAVFEGQYVKEGDKLFEIADLSQMWFRFDVYEQDLSSIRIGQMVRVTSPALGDKVFEGPITFIDPNINEMSRSARVRVELQNPFFEENDRKRRSLYNGLYANGSITITTEPVLAVNRSAVIDPGDQPRVYVDKTGGAYEQRIVALGERGEKFIEIKEGLSPGERVVLSGNLLLDSQAQINQTGSAHQHSVTGDITSHSHATPGTTNLSQKTSVAVGVDQEKAAEEFLATAGQLSSALASDNRDLFNQHAVEVSAKAEKLKFAFTAEPHLSELATAVANASDLKSAQNLVIARSAFLPFSMAVAEFTQALRKHGAHVSAKVYKCPMYPQAGKTAYWVQSEAPLRNPFFGSEMLDCGQEVK